MSDPRCPICDEPMTVTEDRRGNTIERFEECAWGHYGWQYKYENGQGETWTRIGKREYSMWEQQGKKRAIARARKWFKLTRPLQKMPEWE